MRDAATKLLSGVCRAWAAGCLLVLAGCAGEPGGPDRSALPALFPPPPAQAMYRYERSLYGNKDVLEAEGNSALLKFLNKEDRSTGPGLASPHALAVDHGRVYVSDLAEGRVNVFDLPGRRYEQIGGPGPGRLQRPMGLSVERATGELYVVDADAQVILVYDRQGHYLRGIGGPQGFTRLTGVHIDPDGTRLYAIDAGETGRSDPQVRVFDTRNGSHLFDFGVRGSGPGEFNTPYDLAVGPSGQLYVTDSGSLRVQVFDRQGRFVSSFGAVDGRPGLFGRPKAIATDAAGRVYVVDAWFGKVLVFDPAGVPLYSIGGHGDEGGGVSYMLPAGIAIDADGSLYCLDQGYRKIDIFRPAVRP